MSKITPFLWFDGKALEAAKHYVSIFPRSKITSVERFEHAGPRGDETVVSVTFRLDGQEFMALDGGPLFRFSPAISLFVSCKTQREVDHYWTKLSKGGEKQPCGWLVDRYGVTWQIVPEVLGRLLGDRDPVKAKRAMEAMLRMTKLDIAKLEKAHVGRWATVEPVVRRFDVRPRASSSRGERLDGRGRTPCAPASRWDAAGETNGDWRRPRTSSRSRAPRHRTIARRPQGTISNAARRHVPEGSHQRGEAPGSARQAAADSSRTASAT